MLSMTTDFARDQGCPEKDLQLLAETGFSHVHWCHHWNTDFLYAEPEIDQIQKWMKAFGLQLNDLHGSDGEEKKWYSLREYERLAGVELVKNRIHMTARLGSDVVIMHIGHEPDEESQKTLYWDQLWRSLDELQPSLHERGVRIAVENGEFWMLKRVLERYGPDTVGLCYDCGHGNLIPDGLDQVEALKDRLISVHLHDNDGSSDQHALLFSGTVNWERLAGILARSSYKKPVSMEANMKMYKMMAEKEYLQKAFETGSRLSGMVAKA